MATRLHRQSGFRVIESDPIDAHAYIEARAEDAQRLDDLRRDIIARQEVRQQLKWIAVFALVIGIAAVCVAWVAMLEVAR